MHACPPLRTALHECFSGKTPGLIQLVLTALGFLSWVLLLPKLPPSSLGAPAGVSGLATCFMGPWTLACPKDLSVLKLVRRANSLRREKNATAIANRYG